jgi:hypothetical protein
MDPVILVLAGGQSISDFQNASILTVPSGTNSAVTQQVPRPTIAHRELRTKSVLHDNGYVIIGGLMRHRQFQEDRRVPFLGNLPLIGFLFRSRATVDQSTNLIIVVEAKIISPSGRGLTDDPSAPVTEEEALAIERAKKLRSGQFMPSYFNGDAEADPSGALPPSGGNGPEAPGGSTSGQPSGEATPPPSFRPADPAPPVVEQDH